MAKIRWNPKNATTGAGTGAAIGTMALPGWGTAIGGGIGGLAGGLSTQGSLEELPFIGGLFGNAKENDDNAARHLDDAAARWDNIAPAPDYVNNSWLGDVSNENQGDTRLNDISVDPRLRSAQMDALSSLQEIGKDGLSMRDRADLSRVASDTATEDRGRREAIMMRDRQTGNANSGRNLLAQLASSQAATDRNSQVGQDVAGRAEERRLNAINQAGNIGGNIRNQEFGEQAQVATAQDRINAFNVANRNDTNRYNNAGKQAVQTGNVAGQNNYGQNQFDNNIAIARGQSGADTALSAAEQAIADRKAAAKAAGLGSLVSLGTAAYTGGKK